MSGYHNTDISNMENNRNCLRRIARHDEQQFSKDSLVNVMEKFVKTVNIMDETILVPCRLMDRQIGDSTDIIQASAKTPALLQQQQMTQNSDKTIYEFLSAADLFNLYSMLNSLKNDLLWTRSNEDNNDIKKITTEICSDTNGSISTIIFGPANDKNALTLTEQNTILDELQKLSINSGTGATKINQSDQLQTNVKGHNRRTSTASMTSTNSVSNLSDSESDISNENDSGIESEGNCGGSQNSESSNNSQGNSDKATDLVRQCRQHLAGLHRCLEQMTEAANYLTARYQSEV